MDVWKKGVRGITVQAVAGRGVLQAAGDAVRRHNGFMLLDDLGYEGPYEKLARTIAELELPVRYVIVQVAKDDQRTTQFPVNRLREAAESGLPGVGVAGGISAANVSDILQQPVGLVISGNAITLGDSYREARKLRKKLDELAIKFGTEPTPKDKLAQRVLAAAGISSTSAYGALSRLDGMYGNANGRWELRNQLRARVRGGDDTAWLLKAMKRLDIRLEHDSRLRHPGWGSDSIVEKLARVS